MSAALPLGRVVLGPQWVEVRLTKTFEGILSAEREVMVWDQFATVHVQGVERTETSVEGFDSVGSHLTTKSAIRRASGLGHVLLREGRYRTESKVR